MILKKHLQKVVYVFMLLGMILTALGPGDLPSVEAASTGAEPKKLAQTAEEFQSFGPISQSDGWVLMSGRLYSTGNNGGTWTDITPPLSSNASIYAVNFLDTKKGRVLWSSTTVDGSLVLQIAATPDGGSTWTSSPIQTISPDDPDINVDKASMDWLNESTGWISVKRMTGSNFSAGTLYRTDDAGQTWSRSSLPIGGPVYFVNNQVGWVAGGPAGNQLFRTKDGGKKWEEQPAPAGADASQIYSISLPIFDSLNHGSLAIVELTGQAFQARFYTTTDGGENWVLSASLPLNSQGGAMPLTLLDSHALVATVPNDNVVIHVNNGEIKTITNQDGASAAIVDLAMLSSDLGWAKWNTGACKTQPTANGSASSNISCTETSRLLRTTDGGISWGRLALPQSGADTLTRSTYADTSVEPEMRAAGASNTLTLIGHGFDKCEIPSLEQLQTWWLFSPYKAVNLYIGGSARACANTALTAYNVNQMRLQGWTFIPTWVGPQAPCSLYSKKIGTDPVYTFEQGEDEADAAVSALAALGLTFDDQTGSVVYYDMEAYPADATCRTAVNAFMDGWVSRLHTHGNLAGAYASTLNSGLTDFLTIPHVPDFIWPPRWYHNAGYGSYDPTASVWDLGVYVPNTAWAKHQRIRQYEGDHNETWGGVMIKSIDNNVLDGVVAVPFAGDPSENFSASPLSGASPLTAIFHLDNTAFMNSCSWNYGDGKTGTSCAANHSHTYTRAGTYNVTFSVSGPGGTGNMVRNNYITVTQPASFPDLVPSARPGEANPAVLSSLTGTTMDNTLYAGQPVYVDWGIRNNSSTDIPLAFSADLFINNQPVIEYTSASLAAGVSAMFNDWKITWDTAGCFPVKLVVDFYGKVVESNESNNIWTAQYCWQPNLRAGPVPVAPSGTTPASDPIFQWNPVTNASSYELYVYSVGVNNTIYSITGILPNSRCTTALCSYPISTTLSAGDYQYKVAVKDVSNNITYSPWMTFNVGGTPPAPANPGPTDIVLDTRPTFTWNKSTGASWYDLYVYPGGLSIPLISATSIPANSSCTDSTCSWTVPNDLPGAYYEFNIRGRNLAGASSFSSMQKFTVSVENTYRFIAGTTGTAGTVLTYLDGSPRTVSADGSGNYVLPVSDNWSGSVTPSKLGYVFTPAAIPYTGVVTNQENRNYSAVYITQLISGNAGMAGVSLGYMDGAPQTAATDAAGNYSFSVPHGWSGVVTASKNGYFFIPGSHSYTNVTANQSGQNFIIHRLNKIFFPHLILP